MNRKVLAATKLLASVRKAGSKGIDSDALYSVFTTEYDDDLPMQYNVMVAALALAVGKKIHDSGTLKEAAEKFLKGNNFENLPPRLLAFSKDKYINSVVENLQADLHLALDRSCHEFVKEVAESRATEKIITLLSKGN